MSLLGPLRILIVEPMEGLEARLSRVLSGEGYQTTTVNEGNRALSMIYNDPPDLILMDMDNRIGHPGKVCGEIKSDNIYGHLPIIAIMYRGGAVQDEIGRWMVDDFIYKPVDEVCLLLRIRLIFARGERNLDANALTRLPGNNTIIQQIQRRIETETSFALAYMDVDNFKSFNDRYGFSRGDEVLRMSARLAGNVVSAHRNPDAFMGHIGGDDFVFMVAPENVAAICDEIIRNFGQIIPTFYDEADRARGYIESVDRQGRKSRFPLMTVSIGVGLSRNIPALKHFGQITAVASEMKKYAKKHEGSCYFVDRRDLVGQGKDNLTDRK